MAPIQASSLFRSLRVPRTTPRITLARSRPLSTTSCFYAGSSYGDGKGDPKGENPQDQGSSTVTSDKEHPGPPPPGVGQGTGGGPTKKGADGHNTPSFSDSSSGGSASGGTERAQPKIYADEPPHPENQSDDVKAHNADMAKRHEKPHEGSSGEGDEVDKDYWKGEPGLDCVSLRG